MSYAQRHDHPPEQDLVNFARDELGEQKKARILQHCRQCHDCAERLIELTREHAPPAGPLKLTKWNKIWLWLLLFSLVAATAGLVWTLRQMAQQPAMLPGLEAPMPGPETQTPDGEEEPPPARDSLAPGERSDDATGDTTRDAATDGESN